MTMSDSTPTDFNGEKHEEIFVGNQHVANVRKAPGHEGAFVIEAVDGTVLHEVEHLHLAEVWVAQHADDIIGRLT